MSFAELGLSPRLLSALDKAGFEAPTPIQAQAIPHLLDGRDRHVLCRNVCHLVSFPREPDRPVRR